MWFPTSGCVFGNNHVCFRVKGDPPPLVLSIVSQLHTKMTPRKLGCSIFCAIYWTFTSQPQDVGKVRTNCVSV